MNRHDRRAARRQGCLATYTTAALPLDGCPFGNDPPPVPAAAHPAPAHTEADCDGTCHAGAPAFDDEMLGRPDVRLRILARSIARTRELIGDEDPDEARGIL